MPFEMLFHLRSKEFVEMESAGSTNFVYCGAAAAAAAGDLIYDESETDEPCCGLTRFL